jgi:hypothetical protein
MREDWVFCGEIGERRGVVATPLDIVLGRYLEEVEGRERLDQRLQKLPP